MASFAVALKAEIARVARSALREDLERLQRASSHHRSDLAALKRRVADLERENKRLRKAAALPSASTEEAESDAVTGEFRFTPERLVAMRHKLGLTQSDMGLLLGVTGKSILTWEHSTAAPRPRALRALAAIKGLSKKEAAARIAALKEA